MALSLVLALGARTRPARTTEHRRMDHADRLARRNKLDAELKALLQARPGGRPETKRWCELAVAWLREDARLDVTDGSEHWDGHGTASGEPQLLVKGAADRADDLRADDALRDFLG